MAPPKPKPRTELARAAAAADKWAHATPGLSEKQQKAADRNWDYIQQRLAETGRRPGYSSQLTPEENVIGMKWRDKRAARPVTIPKPTKKYKPGDPEWSSDATLSDAEIAKTSKVFVSGKKGRNERILKELERQGFQRPTTSAQANAQIKQLIKKLTTSQRAGVAAALKNPFDVAGNADLIGAAGARSIEEQARARAAAVAAAKPKRGWADISADAVSSATDWVTPDTVQNVAGTATAKTMGIAPGFTKKPLGNLKDITAGIAMGIPALAETVYHDVDYLADLRNLTHPGGLKIPQMAKQMLIGWGQDIEHATPLPADLRKTLGDVAHGRWDDLSDDAKKDFHRMAKEWQEKPFTAVMALWPGVSAGMRIAEFPSIARRIARANPNMSRAAVAMAARKESYVPGAGAARLAKLRETGKGKAGWEGGIPPRMLEGKVIHPETGEILTRTPVRARPPSRGAAGRKLQNHYDRWSSSDGPLSPGRVPGLGRFTELHRAMVALNKGRGLASDAARVALLQKIEPLESYIRQSGLTNKAKNVALGRLEENRARLSETFWGPQGPSGLDPNKTLRAVADDLTDLVENGGLEIPSKKLGGIDKTLRQVNSRLDSLGQDVHLGVGHWAKAANTMREAGYTQGQIEMNLEIASHLARAWAKREPGRIADDWLESPEGRNIADFRYGAPPQEALSQSLFQVLYPSDADIPRHPDNPHRQNRAAMDEQWAAHQAGKASGEIAPDAKFEFDPPHKTAYNLTEASQKSKLAVRAHEYLRQTTDLDGNMLPNLNEEEIALWEKEVAPYLPRDPQKLEKIGTDQEGEAHIGRVTLEEKDANATGFFDALTPEQQELFANWYERVWDYVAYLYGPKKMRQMGDAFFASQAAQSPAGGIANLFRTAEDIANGKPMPSDPNQWLQRNIYKLMKGENLGSDPSGLAAKLMDFMDAGLGMKMRTIMQGAANKFGPGVVDRWTWRSDGYFPKPESDEGNMITRNIKGGVEHDAFLSTDKGGAVAYEYSSRRLQALTDLWNDRGYKGKRDWTVEQVQAIDWFATKKRWVEDGLTPKSAEGGSPLDMALDNTREFVFDGSPEELAAAAEEIGAGVRIVSGKSKEGAEITYSVSKDGKTHAIVAGSGGALDRLRMRLGETGQTVSMRYPGSMGGTKTQRSHQLDIPSHRAEAAGDSVRRVFKKESDHPHLYRMGNDTHRLDFGSGKTGLTRAEKFADDMGIPKTEIQARFTESAGLPSDVLHDVRRLEKAIKRAEGDRAKADAKATASEAKKAKNANRPVRPIKPRKPGDVEAGMISHLDSLRERLGVGEDATDDLILERANQIVGESRGTPEVLHQRVAEGIAGAVEFLDTESGRQVMYLAEHANPSTFYHELVGHAAHEMKREFPAEFAAVEKRYGKELQDWTKVEHEKFATEAERYLMTGKAPVPEMQPVFDAMRAWMKTVYDTIKALGKNRINPETERLLDRYFGKEPLDFTPPARIRRTGRNAFPATDDVAGISRLVDDTADLLMRGADVLRNDPKSQQQIAGSMKWLEQQVLPFVKDLDPALDAKVHDLFTQFEDVKAGSSVFNPDERALIKSRGQLLTKRHAELERIADNLRSQPDHAALDAAGHVMRTLDDPDLNLEDVENVVKELGHVSHEIRMRSHGDYQRQKWQARTVADIEKALDKTRHDETTKKGRKTKQQRDEAINAERDIAEEMKGIYLDVFGEGLTPTELKDLSDTLDARDNLIPNRLQELGLLPEGEGPGSYMPHYSVFDQLFSRIVGPVRLPAAGRNKKTLSMKVKAEQSAFGRGPNRLIRYGTGELRADPRSLLSAYKQRIRFVETKMLREQLWKIAAPIPKDPVTGMPRIPEGWYVINGTGKAVPERIKAWQRASDKERDEMLASGQDFDSMLQSEDGTVKLLQEYRDSWLTNKDDGHKIPTDWDEAGLKMLPPEAVETLVGKVFESAPGSFLGSIAGLIGTAGRMATIFAHPMGYVQANVAANAILLALTNPTRAPRAVRELFKTPGSLRASNPKLFEYLGSLTGDYQASAGIPTYYVKGQTGMENVERMAASATSSWAGFLGGLADQPVRVASWTGHARKYGYNDEAAWEHLAHSTDEETTRVREIVSQRAREDMLDFNKLSAAEQRLTKLLFIYPFIRAAVAQPLWMLREYPARSYAFANLANAQDKAYGDEESVLDRYNAVMPAEGRSMFDLSDVPFLGGTVNMNPVNPVGPFTEKANDLATILEDPKQIGRIAAAQINPAFAAFGQGSFGYGGMDWEKILGSTIPLASYVMAATSAKKRGAAKYNDRSSWFDYLRRRDVRFWPEDVNPEKVREAGKKAADQLDTRPAWEKAQDVDLKTVDKIFAKGKEKTGREVDEKTKSYIVRSVNAYHALDQAEDKLADDLGVETDDLTEEQKIKATEAVLLEYYPKDGPGYIMDPAAVAKLPDTARGGKASKKGYRYHLRDVIQYWRSAAMKEGRDMGMKIE